MSGGVDSSVTAALLKSEGYDVVGITLQLYDHGAATHRKGACCAGQDIHDARNVAERIGIPHYVLDYESRFRESVIDNFADSYASGETPVPCIECNRSIKFRDLLATARELGAAALATGHYVASRRIGDGSRALVCAADADRDQSYFLFATTQRAARLSALSARRHDQAAGARTGAALRPRGRRQAGQPGHLLRADRALYRHHRPVAAECHRARRHRRPRRPRHRPAPGHHSFHRRPAHAASASPPARRSMWCGSMPTAAASWSARARRCGWTASCCATSTGSATARSTARSATALRCSCGCARPARRSRRGCAPSTAAMKSNWSRAKRAYRPARPACSMMRLRARRACSAADSSRARPRRARQPMARRASCRAAGRSNARIRDFRAGHGCRYRPRGGRKGL